MKGKLMPVEREKRENEETCRDHIDKYFLTI